MRKRALISVAAFVLGSGGVLAQPAPGPAPAPVAPAKPLSLTAEVPVPVNVKPKAGAPLFADLTLGGVPFTLGVSTLADVERTFGGLAEQTATARSICLAGTTMAGPSVFWFVSDTAAGGEAQVLTTIAVTPLGPEGAGTCTPAPAALGSVEAAVPTLFAKLGDVRTALGTATPGPVGHVHYAVSLAPADGAGAHRVQTLVYTAARGRVVGVAFSEKPAG